MENIIEKYKDKLPESYLDFIATGERFYGFINEEFGYVDLWELDFLSRAFSIMGEYHENIGKNHFPIGSNGGGFNIIIVLNSSQKELLLIDDLDTSGEYAIFFCENFEKLYNAVKQCKLNKNK